jgi:uncharacterized protein YdiU (UPF0061 family)
MVTPEMSRPRPPKGDELALRFDDRFVRELPGDADLRRTPRQVRGACYSRVLPEPVREPTLLALSAEMAERLGLSEEACASPAFARMAAGNLVVAGMNPYAACYGGHQFGAWAGQLGDGRAITLGEVLNGRGERWELQLKGAGRTPYSRDGDGRAVLRSSLREFLCSEAMHHLGVPTTRALSLVATGDTVLRDMFYDGHPRAEPGAVVARVAETFLRFGSFEILASRGETAILRALADHTLRSHFADLGPPSPDAYAALLAEVARRTARLIAHWMRIGFVHGVLNTDNLSILGLSIDYGPFGFLDTFDPRFTPNTTDAGRRRYRFENQPAVARWNVIKLGQALSPLLGSARPVEEALAAYDVTLELERRATLAGKLGLSSFAGVFAPEPHPGVPDREGRRVDPGGDDDADEELARELFELLSLVETDPTRFFRSLADVPVARGAEASDADLLAPLAGAYYAPEGLAGAPRERTVAWLRGYAERVRREGTPDPARRTRMNAVNPKYIPRNYLAQLAIDAAEAGDLAPLHELFDVLRRPYDDQPGRERFAARRPDWARNRAGCSMLSCSS